MKRPLLLSALLCLAACLLLTAAPAPLPVSAPAPAAPRLLALTFDDGPHPACTDRILDTLAACDAHATFFVLGSKIESSLPQLARMVNEGHMIANHTWDHLDLTKLDAQAITRQIGSVYGSIQGLCGTTPWLVRPPFGFANEAVRQNCEYPIICWSVDTLDWAWLDADRVTAHVLEHADDGAIVLMHDIYPTTADAVEKLVPALQARGFTLVTVAELFARKDIPLEPGHVYYHAG